jgi:hypothetical protein
LLASGKNMILTSTVVEQDGDAEIAEQVEEESISQNIGLVMK